MKKSKFETHLIDLIKTYRPNFFHFIAGLEPTEQSEFSVNVFLDNTFDINITLEYKKPSLKSPRFFNNKQNPILEFGNYEVIAHKPFGRKVMFLDEEAPIFLKLSYYEHYKNFHRFRLLIPLMYIMYVEKNY